MDEASKVLENLTTSKPCLLVVYRKLSPNPPLVDEVLDHNMNLVNPTLSKCESHESVPDQPLVEKMVDLIPPLVDCNFLVECESHTTQVLLTYSDSNVWGEILSFQ